MQALSSVEGGYDLLAPKFDHTPFRLAMACLTRPPMLCARSARSAGDWTCAAAPARAFGSSDPCARDRSWAPTSARACSRRRAVRTPAPDGYGPTPGPCPSPGPSTWRSASGRSGTSCPPNGPRCSPACTARCGPAGCSPSRPARGTRHLRLVLGTARVRPGHAGPQCRVASPVRHVLPHLPAARGPQRPDSSRVHCDNSPADGLGRARTAARRTGLSSRAKRYAHAPTAVAATSARLAVISTGCGDLGKLLSSTEHMSSTEHSSTWGGLDRGPGPRTRDFTGATARATRDPADMPPAPPSARSTTHAR